jgi:hypothetical protein
MLSIAAWMDSQDLAPASFVTSQTIVPLKLVMRKDEIAHFVPGEARGA